MNRLIHIKLFCLPTHFSFQFSQSELTQRLILKDCPYFDIDCHSTQQLLASYVLLTYTPYCDLINHSYKVISLIIAILYPAPVLPCYWACPVMTDMLVFLLSDERHAVFSRKENFTLETNEKRNRTYSFSDSVIKTRNVIIQGTNRNNLSICRFQCELVTKKK